MFVGEIGEFVAGVRVLQFRQGGRRPFVIAKRCCQAGLQESHPPRVAADHVRRLGVGDSHLSGGLRHGAGGDRRVDGQAVADASDGLLYSVNRSAREVDLTKLRKDFQHQVVSIFLLDRRHQGQQQVPGAGFLGGERQAAGALQVAGDRHGCIISPPPSGGRVPEPRPPPGVQPINRRTP